MTPLLRFLITVLYFLTCQYLMENSLPRGTYTEKMSLLVLSVEKVHLRILERKGLKEEESQEKDI